MEGQARYACRPGFTLLDVPMDYQLIIKFWRNSLDDEVFLTTVEAQLASALGKSAVLDGFDVSPKEINLFMNTADPRPAFRRCKDVLEQLGVMHSVSAAYRLVGGAQFTSVWPQRMARKFTLP